MEQPKPISYVTPYKTVVINDPSGIKIVNGVEALDGGLVKQNGKLSPLYVKIEGKPELVEAVKVWRAEWDAYKAYKAAEFAANVPGLEQLRKAQDVAYNEAHRYSNQFEQMMDDENNDGAKPPAAHDHSHKARADALAIQYPRAAVYLRAEAYTESRNVYQYAAGEKAMEIIATGGSIEDANDVLTNWLPESADWN